MERPPDLILRKEININPGEEKRRGNLITQRGNNRATSARIITTSLRKERVVFTLSWQQQYFHPGLRARTY